MEHVLDSKKLNYNDDRHDNHFSCKNPIIFLLIVIKLSFHLIMLIEDLFEFPSGFSDFNQKFAYFFRQLINILFSSSQHFFLFIEDVKLYSCISGRLFLETYWIKTCLIEFNFNKGFVIQIRSSFIEFTSVSIVHDHIDHIDVRIHVVTEQHWILCLIDLKLKTCQLSFYYNLHRTA